jgi:hypothetical protein
MSERKMESDAAVKYSINEVAEKMNAIQKLLINRADDAGPATPQQQRQIAMSATQVGKLLKKIDSLSPGFMEAFKGKLSDVITK